MKHLSSRKILSNKKQSFFFGVFSLIILINPLPLGSNRTWAWSFEAIIASALLIVMLVCSLFSAECINWQRIKKMRLELALIGLWFLANIMYLIPMPISMLELLSPNVASAYANLNLEYGYLSLDVSASYHVLMLSLYYLLLFILGVVLVNSRRRIKFILALFLLLGVFEAIYGMYLVSIGQTGTLVQLITVSANNASGTFVNKNHLVAFLSMCFILGLALKMILKESTQKLYHMDLKIKVVRFISSPMRLLDFCLFLILAGIWNTHSRAGLASFLLALLFMSIFLFSSNKMKTVGFKVIFIVFALITLLLIIVADDVNYLMNSLGQNSSNSIEHILSSAEGRLLAFNQVIDNYHLYWLSGVGPGAYQVFFVNNRMLAQTSYFDHAHNDYVEFLIEYGLFSLILLALLLVFVYRIFIFIFKTNSDFYKYLGICVISCMIYMLLHGNMDFNARIPANIVTIIVAISIIYGRVIMMDVSKPAKTT